MIHLITRPLAVGLCAVLAGCFSNDNDGAANGGNGIKTVSSATQQAATVNALVGSLAAVRGIGSPQPKTLANGECDSGSRGPFTENGRDVGSPFTEQAVDVSGTESVECRLMADFDNSGSLDDYLEYDGRSEAGRVDESGDTVSYLRIGADASTPLAITVHLESEQGGVMINQDFRYDIGLVDHRRAGSTDSRGELFFSIDGSAAGFNFQSRLGASEADGERFVVDDNADGLAIGGSYALTTSPAIPNSNCAGTTTVATDQRLVASGAGFSAGQLTLTRGDDTATVRFNDDDTVTVAAGGDEQTLDQSEFRAAAGPCTGLLLAGFGFAQAGNN